MTQGVGQSLAAALEGSGNSAAAPPETGHCNNQLDGNMARRTKEQSEQTRNTLIDTSFRLFCEKGYSKTTLEEIAAASGVTRGALYWHFKGKEDILVTIFNEKTKWLIDELRSPIHDEMTMSQAIKSFILKFIGPEGGAGTTAVRDRFGVLCVTMLFSHNAAPQLVYDMLAGIDRQLCERIAELIRRGQASGEFSQGIVPIYAAKFIKLSVDGFIINRIGNSIAGKKFVMEPESMADLIIGSLKSYSPEQRSAAPLQAVTEV